MYLEEIVLYLKENDTLIVPEYDLTFSQGILKIKGETIKTNLEDSVDFLLQSEYTNPWFPTPWGWIREYEYTDKQTAEIRDYIYNDILKSGDYDITVHERILKLPLRTRDRILDLKKMEYCSPLNTVEFMMYEPDKVILAEDDWRIERGLLYHNKEQVTDSFQETLRKLGDTPFLNPKILKRTPVSIKNERIYIQTRLEDLIYKDNLEERLRDIPLVFQYLIRSYIFRSTKRPVKYQKPDPTTVREFYAKDCPRWYDAKEECMCIPETRGVEKECVFSDTPLITEEKEKLRLLSDFSPDTVFSSEALSYIKEFPILILKEGDTLCHSTNSNNILAYNKKKKTFNAMKSSLGWWNKFFVGQGKYKGGWFTYETNYGGPGFGLSLFYRIEKDVPVLFVPNYRVHNANKEYYPDPNLPWDHAQGDRYTGSHIVQGPRNWKEKGYAPIVENYFADRFAERLTDLGFPGYISCDECEVFLTHETMKKGMPSRPYRVKKELSYSQRNFPEDFQTVFDSLIGILCSSEDDKCPLEVKEGDREDLDREVLDLEIPRETIEKIMPFERFVTRYEIEK